MVNHFLVFHLFFILSILPSASFSRISLIKIYFYFSTFEFESFCFVLCCSESAQSAAKPTSWPRSRVESHQTKNSREKRKPQSSSPKSTSRNQPGSVGRMKRFQKSTAIYTLPIRSKRHSVANGKYLLISCEL